MKAFRITIAAAFLVSCFAGSAFAGFVQTAPAKVEPQHLRWKGRTIKVALSSSVTQPSSNIKTDSDVIGAIRRSTQAWQNAADIELVTEMSDRQSVSPSGAAGDGVSLITIAQSPENVLLFSKNPQAESAKTRIFYNRKGFITEADIVLNPFQQFSTDGTYGTFDLESTLTHEIGHLLGLRHSAVWGSIMSESVLKNGTFGFMDFGSRGLGASDIAAIRELYGEGKDDDTCCGAIAGKLTLGAGRPAKQVRVWAEDSETGRVIAQDETGGDGAYRLGGLPAAKYSIFWQKKDDASGGSFGEVGKARVSDGETSILNEKIVQDRSEIVVNYAGINGQLADSAIPLNAGREYVVYLGGNNLDAKKLNVEFNSSYLKVSGGAAATQNFGDHVSVISVIVTVDRDAPSGSYSIFVTGSGTERAALIGALRVE